MKKITLTLEFDENDMFVDNCLLNAAIFLNGIDFGFVLDCCTAIITVDGLPFDYQVYLADKIRNNEKEAKIDE